MKSDKEQLPLYNGFSMITLMDFYADWCGPCHAMKPVFEKVMPDYNGKVSLEKIDVDQNQAKAQEYGVMSIPTMVIIKDGKEVDRRIGMLPENGLRQWFDSHLS